MYDGEMVFVWKDDHPARGDQGLAELLVDRAHHIIEQRRMEDALTEAAAATERMRTALVAGQEISTAMDKLRATKLADKAGYEMLRRAREERAASWTVSSTDSALVRKTTCTAESDR